MYSRVVDISEGIAMVITDLHGNLDAYLKYRDHFTELYNSGKAHRMILCGDLIHHEEKERDYSLEILWDVIQMQENYGANTITMLMGNHELPHVYGIPLCKDKRDCTPYFEARLSSADKDTQNRILRFLDSLPFYARTSAGVMITHAGAHCDGATPKTQRLLATFDHQAILKDAENWMDKEGREKLVEKYKNDFMVDYDLLAQYLFAAKNNKDPKYYYLVRSQIIQRTYEFSVIWNALFSGNENEMGKEWYETITSKFLDRWSQDALSPQKFLVTGHIQAENGYQIVGKQQLRIASYAHAIPQESGKYLLLDCAKPVESMNCLRSGICTVFGD